MTSSANPSPYGQAVTFTAVVSSPASGTPTGTVSFAEGGTSLGTATLSVVNGHDQATLSTSALPLGYQTLTATYAGDGTFQGSSNMFQQDVQPVIAWVGPTFTWSQSQSPPVVTNPGNQTNAEGDVVSLQIGGTGPNDSPPSYDAVNLPSGLSINASTGQISGSIGYQAAEDFGGSYPVSVLVTDAQGGGTEVSFTWTVTDTPRPPVLNSISNQSNAAGDTVSLQVNASQPDGDPLFYDAAGLPSGLVIDNSTGLISGTIDPSAVSSTPYVVTVTVTDYSPTTDQSASLSFNWMVGLGTPSPSLDNPGSQANAVGDAVDLALNAADAGGYTLTCTASGLPAGLSIDPGTGEITGTIANSAASPTPYTVTVTASDGSTSSTQTFSWAVSGVTVTDPGDQSNAVGDTVSLQIAASDLNNSALTFSATGLPNGLAIGSNTGLISGTVAAGAATTGWFDVVVTATDGTYSTNSDFSWWVASSNNSGSQLGAAQGTTITGTEGVDSGSVTVATFTDTDASVDLSSFDAIINWGDGTSSEGVITGSGSTYTVTGDHAYSASGSYSTDVSVTDGFATVDGIGSATITDAPLSFSGGVVEGAVAGSSVSGPWASFTDLNPTGAPGSYTATINWGDGSAPTAGTVTGSDGEFLISGTHTYAAAGAYTVTVSVSDAGGV